jgi:hypothetical protein
MWVDHILTKGVPLGVRQVSYSGGVFDCREMTPCGTDTTSLVAARKRLTLIWWKTAHLGVSLCVSFARDTNVSYGSGVPHRLSKPVTLDV